MRTLGYRPGVLHPVLVASRAVSRLTGARRGSGTRETGSRPGFRVQGGTGSVGSGREKRVPVWTSDYFAFGASPASVSIQRGSCPNFPNVGRATIHLLIRLCRFRRYMWTPPVPSTSHDSCPGGGVRSFHTLEPHLEVVIPCRVGPKRPSFLGSLFLRRNPTRTPVLRPWYASVPSRYADRTRSSDDMRSRSVSATSHNSPSNSTCP